MGRTMGVWLGTGGMGPWRVEVVLAADLGALLSPVARLQLDHALRYA